MPHGQIPRQVAHCQGRGGSHGPIHPPLPAIWLMVRDGRGGGQVARSLTPPVLARWLKFRGRGGLDGSRSNSLPQPGFAWPGIQVAHSVPPFSFPSCDQCKLDRCGSVASTELLRVLFRIPYIRYYYPTPANYPFPPLQPRSGMGPASPSSLHK